MSQKQNHIAECMQELAIITQKLAIEQTEQDVRAAELVVANKNLVFQNAEKERRAAELLIANEELVFQNAEKEKRAAELLIANEELIFQNAEKEARAVELNFVNDSKEAFRHQVNQMQKIESIGRLTSGIAHDFNNILACILGYNELNRSIPSEITDEALRVELEYNTKQVDIAGQRAVALIKKMLTYSRQETKRESMNVKPTPEVINEVLTMLRPALTRQIKLKTALNCADTIEIDVTDLHQILTNLAVNARDAMKERGGVITISLKKATNLKTHCVACADALDGNFIELSVSDNGTGIEPQTIIRMFDPFFTTKKVGEDGVRFIHRERHGASFSRAYFGGFNVGSGDGVQIVVSHSNKLKNLTL